jgi:hypothetical protein
MKLANVHLFLKVAWMRTITFNLFLKYELNFTPKQHSFSQPQEAHFWKTFFQEKKKQIEENILIYFVE